MKNHQHQHWFIFVFALLALLIQTGCMTVQQGGAVISDTNSQQYNGKKVAALPIKIQAGLATDSILPLRQEINKHLGQVVREKLANSTVLDVAAVVNELNQRSLLPAYEQIIATYENTGIMDRKMVQTLAHGLGSDYLLFTRLKAEKMDIVISRGFGASIDAMLVDAISGEVTWSGTGEWKRGGVYGFGETKMDEAAAKLLELSFSSLQPIKKTTTATQTAAQNPPVAPVAKETVLKPEPLKAAVAPQTKTTQQIQRRLTELGYQPGAADGKAGKKTIDALKKFQGNNHLAITGQADNETVAKLFEANEFQPDSTNLPKKSATESAQKSAPAKAGNLSEL